MTVVLVESLPDPASVGIATALRSSVASESTKTSFESHPVLRFPTMDDAVMVTTPALHIRDEHLDRRLAQAGIKADLIVFLSKHQSETGRPTLTAHPVGNFGEARYGGEPATLGPSRGDLLTEALRALVHARDARAYAAEVSFEATHHGPVLDVPSIFFELGSGPKDWDDPAGHRVLADAAERLLSAAPWPDYPRVVGLGGGHYGPRFTEAALTKRVHFAHIVPSYHAKAIADPRRTAQRLKDASPGADSFYYHDGSLPKENRDAWFAAFQDAGLRQARSREWSVL
jgi:D-aminoacyl-tRNA deacylase